MDRILFSCSESQPAYYGMQWMDFSFSTSKDDNGDDDTICSYCYYYLCENRISVSCRTRHCCRRRFKYCDVFSFPGSMSDAIFGSASCAFFAIFIFSHSVDDATNKHSDFMCGERMKSICSCASLSVWVQVYRMFGATFIIAVCWRSFRCKYMAPANLSFFGRRSKLQSTNRNKEFYSSFAFAAAIWPSVVWMLVAGWLASRLLRAEYNKTFSIECFVHLVELQRAEGATATTTTTTNQQKNQWKTLNASFAIFYLDCRHQRLPHCITDIFVSRKRNETRFAI